MKLRAARGAARLAEAPPARAAAAEAERVVAWLRLPAVALLALVGGLEQPNAHERGFVVVLALFSAWSAGVLAWVHLRPAGQRLALLATGVDIVAFSVLSMLSGGAFSHARLALFVVPVAVAFRFRASMTALATVVATSAYVIQAVAHPAASNPEATRFIATQAGFLAWIGLACALLSLLLGRRTEEISRLATARSRLLADALEAEQRERRTVAESLHDHALQNLLSARHELDEGTHDSLERADTAIAETIAQLRDAVFELHPYVLEQVGLAAALRSAAQQAASRAGLSLELDLRYGDRHPREQLLFSAARELLGNVVRHAGAKHVSVLLAESNGYLELAVEDDGRGFPPERIAERLAEGHVGLASQRVRVEAAGGSLDVESAPDRGTRVSIRVPSG